jgi:hypothetical protein
VEDWVVDVKSCTGTGNEIVSSVGRLRDGGSTFGASYNRTALIRSFLDFTVLTDRLGERAYSEIAHEHPVMASTIQTWFVRDYPVSFVVMLEVVVAAGRIGDRIIFDICHVVFVQRGGYGCLGYQEGDK